MDSSIMAVGADMLVNQYWGPSMLLLLFSYPAEVAAAALIMAVPLPRRPRFPQRLLAIIAAYFIGSITLLPLLYAAGFLGLLPFSDDVATLLGAVLLMLSTVPAILFVFEATPWQALFCATAGWTCQNLASGLAGTISLLSERLFGVSLEITLDSHAVPIWAHLLLIAVSVSTVYLGCYLLFVRRIRKSGLGDVQDRRMLAVLVVVITVVIIFDMANKELEKQAVSLEVLLVLRMVHATVCLFVLFTEYEMLYSRSLEERVALSRRMAAERERQWRLSQENREAIDVKCHDIRHQIRLLADSAGAHVDQEFLADLAREVDVYDSLMDTGNEALDTILSEKALICEREAIELSCIADGAALGFMRPPEVYAFFGNALDNAMQATRRVDDPERRSISLVVRRVGELVSIHMENYFVGELTFEHGLPKTTQSGPGHGLGTHSMRGIVERYGGTLALSTRGNVFTLDALIPIETAAEAAPTQGSEDAPRD